MTDEELRGLLLPVLTRADLDRAEADNITRARVQVLGGRRRPLSVVLTQRWMCRLHRRMFDEVWSWAETLRRTDRNNGVEPWRIGPELKVLIDDVTFWAADTGPFAMPGDEVCVRLSHRAVQIHPFANGNGRWSRLLADVAATALDRPVFSWGGSALRSADDTRRAYLEALRVADRALDYQPLLTFARS